MTTLQHLASPLDGAPASEAVSQTIDRLRAGDTFVELLDDHVDQRAAQLAAVLDEIAEPDVKLIWTGNPLRSPLTIERLVLQAAGPEADLRVERSAEQLAHMLALRLQDEPRRLVIVQQPETLDVAAREALAAMAPYLAAAGSVQFLFCGTTMFQRIGVAVPPPSAALAIVAPEISTEAPALLSRREAAPLLLLLAVASVGAAGAGNLQRLLSTARSNEAIATPARAAQPVPAAPPNPPASPPAPPSTRETSAPTITINVDSLRREFDQFLAAQPRRAASLTQDQRDALFEEYLQRARTTVAARPL